MFSIYVLPGLADPELERTKPLARTLRPFGKVTVLPSLPAIGRGVARSSDFDRLLDDLAAIVAADPSPRPKVLAGYSVGGTLAVGLAARLAAAGDPPAFLVLLDSSAAYPPAPPNLLHDLKERFRSGILAGTVMAPFLILMRLDQLRLARLWTLAIRRIKHGRLAEDMTNLVLIRCWVRAISRAALPRVAMPVHLFKASKPRPRIVGANLGWEAHADDLRVEVVQGSHWSILGDAGMYARIAELCRIAASGLPTPGYASAAAVRPR